MVVNSVALIVFIIVFLILILAGVPVAFALGTTAIISAGCIWGFDKIPITTLAQRTIAGVNGFTTLAIPLFLFAGKLMNEGEITDRIFAFCDTIVGRFRGGLAYVNILSSVIFSGMSGSASADAAGLGAIEINAMTKAGYDKDFSCAVTGASALISPIIPPSVIMVTYGVIAGASVTKLFLGGIFPGLLMGIAQGVLVFFLAKKQNMPRSKAYSGKEIWSSFRHAFFSLLTPVLIIGGIWTGIFTPTEAAAVTVFYAMILSVAYRSITLSRFIELLRSTIVDCAAILFIIATINSYSYVLTLTNLPTYLATMILNATSNPTLILLMIILFLLIAGCFMSAMECIMLFTPIFLPLLKSAHIDLVFFGVIMCVTLMIGQLTPPFGTSLFIISKISNRPITSIFKASLPFIVTVLVVIALCIMFPGLITFAGTLVPSV